MDKKRKRIFPSYDPLGEDLFMDRDIVASATECTGLIPTPPLSEEEAESYSDIYDIPKVENEADNDLQHP